MDYLGLTGNEGSVLWYQDSTSLTPGEIARVVGIPPIQVRRILREHGRKCRRLPKRRREPTVQEMREKKMRWMEQPALDALQTGLEPADLRIR